VNLHDFTRLNQCEALEHQAGQNCWITICNQTHRWEWQKKFVGS
jgi:hypothetical protein